MHFETQTALLPLAARCLSPWIQMMFLVANPVRMLCGVNYTRGFIYGVDKTLETLLNDYH